MNDPKTLPMPVHAPRPGGITLLATLHGLGGAILVLVVLPMALLKSAALDTALAQVGLASIDVLVTFGFLGILYLSSGIGMWRGARAGWWLAVFSYVYGILRNLISLLLIPSLVDQFGSPARGAAYYYTQNAGQAVISALLVLYLLKRNVLEYFGLGNLTRKKGLGFATGAAIGVVILGELLGLTVRDFFLNATGVQPANLPLIESAAADLNLQPSDLDTSFSLLNEYKQDAFADSKATGVRDGNQRMFQSDDLFVESRVLVFDTLLGDTVSDLSTALERDLSAEFEGRALSFEDSIPVTVGDRAVQQRFSERSTLAAGYGLFFVKRNLLVRLILYSPGGKIPSNVAMDLARRVEERTR